MLSLDNQKKVEQAIVDQELMTKEQIEDVRQQAIQENKPFLTKLIEANYIDEEQLTKTVAKVNDVPYVNLRDANIDPKFLSLLPKEDAERYMAVPLGEMHGRLAIAMLDASNVQAIDYIANKIGRPISVFMASQESINHVLEQYSANVEKDVKEALANIKDSDLTEEELQAKKDQEKMDEKKVKTIVQDSPISRALSAILNYAVQMNASDIHMEPTEENMKVRVRVDGILREVMTLPKSIEPAMISRVKILSGLKIDEHRVPQDGQFQIQVSSKEIDLRIAIAPVVWGEQVVIRLLDKDENLLDLNALGFRGGALRAIKEGISKPHGMVLSSGPTGSGKSTSLYTLISEIKSEEINIVTLEDPVEYKMEGVNQIQVNPRVGLTFASGLRSILRQDPDVVMVGEIRDEETASLAVQAALTGHLVFSTLHTNSAAGVLPRLLDMNVEPYLIASTVNTVIGQRLVRRVNDDREERESTEAETLSINEALEGVLPETDEEQKALKEDLGYERLPKHGKDAYTLFKGKESKESPDGYKGRVGIYEVYSVSDAIQHLLVERATSSEIQQQAQEEGMITMKQDGYLKALNGLTTLEEVARVASDH